VRGECDNAGPDSAPACDLAGLDLDPVDISDPNQAACLEALVWPEQSDRLAKLRIAMRIVVEKSRAL